MSDKTEEYDWKQGDTAYHPVYGKVEVFYVSKSLGCTEVTTEHKFNGRHYHVAFTKELYKTPECGALLNFIIYPESNPYVCICEGKKGVNRKCKNCYPY
jgi:hypothetical protein